MNQEKKPHLSDRLSALVAMLRLTDTTYDTVADVGCDHGWIAITLILEQMAAHVIASDVREGPLQRAREHIEMYGLSHQIQPVLSDGLRHLAPGQAQAAVIAGMGGFLIRDICLEAHGRGALPEALILQPQNGWQELRESLRDMGYRIPQERMVMEDGKYYVILCAQKELPGSQQEAGPLEGIEPSLADQFGGQLLSRRDDVLHGFLRREERKFSEICAGLGEQQARDAALYLQQVQKALQYWRDTDETGATD